MNSNANGMYNRIRILNYNKKKEKKEKEDESERTIANIVSIAVIESSAIG